jgi:CO/xanthine dehydrogenase Mo-binding subunit
MVTVRGSLQCPYYVHTALVALFGLPPERIRVIQMATGGGFGGKEEYPSILACHAAVLAKKAGRPVKMVYDRIEDVAATTKRHPSRTRHRTAVRKDGTLVAMDIDFLIDGGAYVTLSPVVLSRGAIHAAGPYRCEHVHVRARAVATSSPPHGAFRGFGAPQSIFALERHMDRIAATLGIDPVALRRKNLLRKGERTAVGQEIREDVDLDAVIDREARGVRAAQRDDDGTDPEGHRARRVLPRRGLHRRGRGAPGQRRARRSDGRWPRARARGEHRDRPGHEHDLRAVRRRRAVDRARSRRRRAARYGERAEQRTDRGLADLHGRGQPAA